MQIVQRFVVYLLPGKAAHRNGKYHFIVSIYAFRIVKLSPTLAGCVDFHDALFQVLVVGTQNMS